MYNYSMTRKEAQENINQLNKDQYSLWLNRLYLTKTQNFMVEMLPLYIAFLMFLSYCITIGDGTVVSVGMLMFIGSLFTTQTESIYEERKSELQKEFYVGDMVCHRLENTQYKIEEISSNESFIQASIKLVDSELRIRHVYGAELVQYYNVHED